VCGKHATHDVFVNFDTKSVIDLLGDADTTELWIPALPASRPPRESRSGRLPGFIKANCAGWKNAKHADQWLMTLLGVDQKGEPTRNDYCKTIRDLPIGAIDTTLVLRIIEPIWATKTETASRIRSRIEQVIDAAKAKGEFKGENPARWKGHLDNPLPATSKVRKVRNHPALPYRQLPNFMRKLRERGGVAAAALEFQILTAVRPGNAVAAKWDQIDRQTSVWTRPHS
jgi:integrase